MYTDEEKMDKHMDMVRMIEKADNTVMVASAAAAATGAIPIPFADMPILITEQVAMMARISSIFEIKIEQEKLKALVTAVVFAGGAGLIGRTVFTSAIKFIPIGGSIVGGAVSAGTAGVITFAVGKSFIEICKMHKLGKLSSEDMFSQKGINLMKKSFKKNYKQRKQDTE